MSALNILVKPASSLCNMRCKYCFYRDVADNRSEPSHGIMREDTVDAFLKNVFSYPVTALSFTFQGGEPTLAGENYFKAFHVAVEKYNTRRIPISFSLQTNGYDISDGLMEIFSKYRYLLGVSLDGDAELHDLLRPAAGDLPTYEKINETIRRLDSFHIDYNILTVITENVAKRGNEVYRSLRDRKFKFLQFIPYVSDFGESVDNMPYALTNKSYAHFLKETFKEFHRDFVSGNYVSVRQFDNFVRIAAGMGAECCGMAGSCFANLVVEADGSTYPCDFYVLDKWKMGNITTDSIDSLLASDAAKDFVLSSGKIEEECKKCPYLSVCRGGCRRHRDDGFGNIALNRYCEAYKDFFSECMPLIMDIVRRLCKK